LQIILLGAPGAGKGTQAVFLSKELGLAHIASGDLFRKAQNEGTELGILAKSYMENGQLVPNELTVRMILERITDPDCSKGFILDGFPRNMEQAETLDKALTDDKAIDRVVYIKVSPDELVRRLGGRWICKQCQTPYNLDTSPPSIIGKCDKCGGELYQRPDDKEETIRKRLEVYFTQTLPLTGYYQKAGKLVEVNGEQGIEKVGKELVAVLQ
jgi:adenylate kinase